MHPHRIGAQLRAAVLLDRQQGRPLDPRRLQAVIGDLCADGQTDLVAPLRYLVLSGAFASAAGMDPPLADGRQLQRLQNELDQMFAPPLCARLRPVLEGLLALPASPSGPEPGAARSWSPDAAGGPGAAPTAAAPAAWGLPADASTAPAGPPASGGSAPGGAADGSTTALNAVLALLTAVLVLVLAGLGLLLWQRHNSLQPGGAVSSAPAPAAEPGGDQPAALPPPAAPPAALQPAPTASPAATAAAPLDRAVSSIQDLYAALSAKDFARARGLFAGGAADQFEPGFFRQFERVSVQDLRSTGQVGSTLNLEGVVTFVWPDGSLQTETRSFSVDTSSDPAVITASEFGRVITPR